MSEPGDAPRRALVLRPEPGDAATAARIEALGGWRAVCVPLTLREETEAEPPSGPFDALVLTSAAAAGPAAARAPWLRDAPVHAIGEATARAAREAGFARVTSGADGRPARDGAALGRALGPTLGGARILYPCAEERRPGFERSARAAGIEVVAWPLYRTLARADGTARLAEALEEGPVEATLLHAPSAARALARAAADLGLDGGDRFGTLLCLSDAVADALPDVWASRLVAPMPDDASLVACLGEPDVDRTRSS